jgi:hypothetical protein
MTWNHWPVAFINSQGKRSLFPSRITHSALCAADNTVDLGNMAMYGFTKGPVTDLIPLVKSWNNPPKVSKVNGIISVDYIKEERAYLVVTEEENVSFEIEATVDSPLVNPCFVIKNVNSKYTKINLKINGKEIVVGKDFRQGLSYDMDGKSILVVWLKVNTEQNMRFKFVLEESS